MKRFFMMVTAVLLGVACGLLSAASVSAATGQADPSVMARRFVILRQVQIGMSRTEVRAVLALPVIVGYELRDRGLQRYKPLTEENPRKSQSFKRGGKEYFVDYYLVGIQNQDGKITDDELAPLVFYREELIGMGWDYLNKLK